MNIDKRALREVAERATQGPWEMEQENIWFTDEDGYTKHLAYVEQGDDVDDKQDHYNTAYIAAANPATMLALLDENIQLQREKDAIEAVALALRDDMRQAREQLEEAEKLNAAQQGSLDYRKFLLLSAYEVQRDFAEALGCAGDNESIMEAIDDMKQRIAELESKNGYLQTIAHEQNELAIRANLDSINDAVEIDTLHKRIAETDQRNAELTARIEPMDRRIAELERSETQLINERDSAESALNDAYKAVMGQAPEWSNWFSFENAIDEIELACEQWRNQTDDVIQFRQRIQELEAREILLPERISMLHRTDFHEDYHTVMAYKVSDVIAAIRAAGIKVKGE